MASLVLLLGACASPDRLAREPGGMILDEELTGDGFRSFDGTWLPLRAWGPEVEPAAVFVAVHGMNDYSRGFALPGAALEREGGRLYALDQRGHGLAPDTGHWAGHESMTRDVVTLLHLAREKHGDAPLFLLGESMGAAIAVLAATSANAPALDGLILSSPAIRKKAAVPLPLRVAVRVGASIAPGLKVSLRDATLSNATDNTDILREMSDDVLIPNSIRLETIIGVGRAMDAAADAVTDVTVPTLVLFGGNDTLLPKRDRELVETYMRGVLPHVTMRHYPDGHHLLFRDIEAEPVYEDLLQWTRKSRSPTMVAAY